jgi:hypothetical protein
MTDSPSGIGCGPEPVVSYRLGTTVISYRHRQSRGAP